MMKIILLRHGQPDFKPHWLAGKNGVMNGLGRYAASRVTTAPSAESPVFNLPVNICITSKLSRAMDSARLLGFANSESSELFNESELPHPNHLIIPLPWNLFLLIYRLLWFAGFSQNCAGKFKDQERACEASRQLSQLAFTSGDVLLVGHGIMNRLICSELVKLGWSVHSKSGSGYWSSITLFCDTP